MDLEQSRHLRRHRHSTLDAVHATDAALGREVEQLIRRFEAEQRIRSAGLPEELVVALDVVEFDETTDFDDVLRRLLADLKYSAPDIDDAVEHTKKTKPHAHATNPLGNHPAVARQLAKVQVHDIATVARIPARAATALAAAAPAPSEITDAVLNKLVAAKSLTAAQAAATGLAASIYQLTGQDAGIATAVLADPTGHAVTSTQDLASLRAADWTAYFTAKKTPLPSGVVAQALGQTLADRFAAMHPSAALIGRTPAIDPVQLLNDIATITPLFAHNAQVIGVPLSAISSGLSDAQLAPLLDSHQRLTQLVNTYPGLQLSAVIDDPSLTPEPKVDMVVRRTGFIAKVAGAVGNAELLQLNLATDSQDLSKLGLDKLGATAEEQQMVLRTFQSYQRVWSIARSADHVLTLVQNGFHSGISIATQTLGGFQAKSGLSAQTAQAMWYRARGTLADVALTAGGLLDIIHGLNGPYAGNQSPSAQDYLKQLAGFQDLFGNLSFCACQECQSILGPAAYFVDLMKFIDDNLRVQFPTPGAPLDLKTRRPDLWTLELSCANTNTRIALLDIVNPVLENYIALALGYAGSLADRNAIGDLVYNTTLATRVDSLQQPFSLPLARLSSYLTKFSASRSDVALALDASSAAFAQTELDLSALEVSIVTTPNINLVQLGHIYGLTFTGTQAAVGQVDASVLDAAMGLSREDLGALAATAFVAAGGATVTIVATKRDINSVQNDIEWVRGLTADALDRMHRFTRLSVKTGCDIPGLDLIVKTLGATDITPATLVSVAQIRAVMRRLTVTVDAAASLVGSLPQTPAGASTFDSLFNTPSYVASDGLFPKPTTHFVHPAFRQNTAAPIDPNLPRLLSGLSVDLNGLASLARRLAPHLAQEVASGFNPQAPNEDDRYFVLSSDNLTLLYRHARLASLLRLPIDDLFDELDLLQLDRVSGLADLLAVISLHDWRVSAGMSVADVSFAAGQPPRNPALYPDAATVAAGIVATAKTALTFSNTVFAVALGTTEQGSIDLIAANPAVLEATANSAYRLVAGIDLTTAAITISPSATVPTPPAGTRLVTADEVRGALQTYLAGEILVRGVGKAFNIVTDKVRTLARLGGQSLNADPLVRAVRGDAPLTALTNFVAVLIPLNVAFSDAAWDAAALDFVGAHPGFFGSGPLPNLAPDAQHPNAPFLTLDQIRALSVYAELADRQTGTPPNTTPVDPADIQALLLAFNAALPGFPPTSDAAMARVLNIPPGLLVGLRPAVALASLAATALGQMDHAAQVATALGLDGDTFAALASNDYAALSHAADALIAILRSRITDETSLNATLETLEQPVREAKRDALTDYLINSTTPKLWSARNELYEYFLIDVNAGGCQTTSLVVAATMSAQLYFYRALMNLEQDSRAANDPAHFVLRVPAEAALEWDWRKNYRVWQANREVFLWPENYMVPDLRDDKTPLFQEIEQELLQTSLTDQDVLDAYTKYLSGLNEVANLAIAGAYHQVITGAEPAMAAVGGVSDVLHLFGCTADDPPIYYYRTCQNLIYGRREVLTGPIWSPWQKVTVQISSRRVAPVVHLGRLHVFWSDVKTQPRNAVSNGASQFVGYKHQTTIKFTTLRADGMWTPPQQLRLPPGPVPSKGSSGLLSDPYTSTFGPARGMVLDPLASSIARLDVQRRNVQEPIDDYTLSGANWEGIWPTAWSIGGQSGLEISYRDFLERRQVDLYSKTVFDLDQPWTTDQPTPYPQVLCAQAGGDTKPLFWGVPNWMPYPAAASANLVIDELRMDALELDAPGFKPVLTPGLYIEQIATIPAQTRLLSVPGSVQDGIVQVGDDVLLLQGSIWATGYYLLTRIGTTLVDDIARRLFEDGVNAVLDIKTQEALAEAGLPISLVGGKIIDRSNTGKLDFTGAYGTYYREIFLYLPWLIAYALNAKGSYESSHNWWRYIFDPTADEAIDVTGLPPDEAAHRVLDRVWRYREFRGLDLPTLRGILTDSTAIALYKRDPFNPWAIARRRLSAFQKAIVMGMVGNLFDWADSLFRQFTMESVNEAMMLYIMASDILGPRPVALGDCGVGVTPDNYQNIGPLIDSSSEILIELETWTIGWRYYWIAPPVLTAKYVTTASTLNHIVAQYPLAAMAPSAQAPAAATAAGGAEAVAMPVTAERDSLFTGLDWRRTRTAAWAPPLSNRAIKTQDAVGGRSFNDVANKGTFAGWAGRFGITIIRHLTPAFCVPANATLLGYWDRLADRLYKIHHCQDIDGNLRQLALFAPQINPMQLVAMTAAGLSLDDVLGASSGDLPPYRFSVLIERAKSFAATLSGFGASLLSALEKKDAETLNRLRLTQQMNLAQMTTQIRQAEIDSASASVDSLNAQLNSGQYRSGFYDGLISQSRTAWEYTQTGSVHAATGIKGLEATFGFMASVFGFLPQIGSPFAMKYGGVELKNGTRSFADATGTLGAIADAIGTSAGLEGTFDRRTEGWKNLKQLADNDIAILNKQITAATIRLNIANDALALHQKGIDQIQELIDFADDRLTNLGLYTWLSAQLQSLYRSAFQNGLAVAMLAQQAYRFERGDDTLPGLSFNYWDPANAGLLAGDRLLLDLQTLERRYLETNYRTLEIDQPFALSQVDPQALLELRETGECTFTINETYIDLFYPGHYKRQIKAARLTIPCITGPYVNVSGTLTLLDSWIRPTPALGGALVEVPPSRSVSVASSTAQNDGGVFELLFRDERYMPFEGLGAISQWNLRLPKAFPQFDYQTVNDAVLWISYTAYQDGALRDRVESASAAAIGSIVNFFSNNPAKRLISLRQDFSSAYTRLLRSPTGTSVTVTLTDRNMPMLAHGRSLSVTRAMLLLKLASGVSATGVSLTLDGTPLSNFAQDPTLGDLPDAALPAAFAAGLYGDHTFVVTAGGGLAPMSPRPGDVSAVDPALLLDVLLYFEYKFQ